MMEVLLLPLLAGVIVACIAAPLGCFVVWRRMSYFGDTISHSSLLGVSLAVLLDTYVVLGVFVMATAISLLLFVLERNRSLSTDAILGILSHSSLAIGLVALSLMVGQQSVLMDALFGNVLSVEMQDIYLICIAAFITFSALFFIWRPLLADTASYELAQAEGMRPGISRIVFMLLIASLIAVTMKIIGILLITALLIIPAATARRFSKSPEQMAVIAAILGVTAVISGLYGSFEYDTPPSPSIVLASFIFFVIGYLPLKSVRKFLTFTK